MKSSLGIILILVILAGCSSREAQKTDSSTVSVSVQGVIDAGRQIYESLNRYANRAQSLAAEGMITLSEKGSSQSGSFDLKSKRISLDRRVDSLSIIISGPFGITAAKFLGSPSEYSFYNVLEGDKYRGRPDPKTLEDLTGMKGLSIEALSNVMYGLAPNLDPLSPADSVLLHSPKKDEHFLFVKRSKTGIVERLRLRGVLTAPLALVEYQRWNKSISLTNGAALPPADISINYDGTIANDAYRLPNYIRAKSGGRELEVEYRNVKQNPDPLVVRIKMPE